MTWMLRPSAPRFAAQEFITPYSPEQNGLIEGEWESPPKGRRIKSYRLTREGRRHLLAEKASWRRVVIAMTLVLETS